MYNINNIHAGCKKSNFEKKVARTKNFKAVKFFVWTEQKYSKHVVNKSCFVYLT